MNQGLLSGVSLYLIFEYVWNLILWGESEIKGELNAQIYPYTLFLLQKSDKIF